MSKNTDESAGIATPMSRRAVLYGSAALAMLAASRSAVAAAYAAPVHPVVLITGTSSGFGRLMAEGFARHGSKVVATMRDVKGRNAKAAGAFRDLARSNKLELQVIEVDVLNEDSIATGVAEAVSRFGRIDVLVNNASMVVPGPIELLLQKWFQACWDTNTGGLMRMTRAVAPHMRAVGGGTIIHMSSALAREPHPMMASYCATKSAAEAVADTLSYELSSSNIEVAIVEVAAAYPTELQRSGLRYWNEALAEQGDKAAPLRKHYEPHIRELVEHFERTLPRDTWEVANAVIAMADLPFGSRPGRLVVGSDAPELKAVNAAHAALQRNMIGRSTIPSVIKPI